MKELSDISDIENYIKYDRNNAPYTKEEKIWNLKIKSKRR